MVQVFWRSRLNPNAGEFGSAAIERQRENQRILQYFVAGLHKRGVTLLAGTDAPNPTTVPGDSLYTELELLVESGLTSEAATRSATTAAADHIDNPNGGRIQVRAQADFLLLDGNPLQELSRQRDDLDLGQRFGRAGGW